MPLLRLLPGRPRRTFFSLTSFLGAIFFFLVLLAKLRRERGWWERRVVAKGRPAARMEQRVSGEWKRRKVNEAGILRLGETAR
jgi:hypothetical protein